MADENSYLVDTSNNKLHGFCKGFELRRSLKESEADAGTYECRRDWSERVGPIHGFGGYNPVNGNILALVVALCKPERMRGLAYIYELGILLDDALDQDSSTDSNEAVSLNKQKFKNECITENAGSKWAEIEIMKRLGSIDKRGLDRIQKASKEWNQTTLASKDAIFKSMEEFLQVRVIESGSYWLESTMLWGMQITLTPEEDKILQPLRFPCFAVMGLVNDYFSFEREKEETRESGCVPRNAVNLNMGWYGIDADTAKAKVKHHIIEYEREFLRVYEELRRDNSPLSSTLDMAMKGLAQMLVGLTAWSVNCPRYHKEFRNGVPSLEAKIIKDHGFAQVGEIRMEVVAMP